MATKEKELYEYVKQEMGEKPSRRAIRQTEKAIDGIGRDNSFTLHARFRNNIFFGHAMTALVAVALCLAIVLPMTLPIRERTLAPEPIVPHIYTDNIVRVRIPESSVRSIPNILLFSPGQLTLGGFIPMWGFSAVEMADDAPLVLSYIIEESWLTVGANVFMLDYRIRTHSYYHFTNHFGHFYSALEIANERYIGSVNESIIQTFTIEESE